MKQNLLIILAIFTIGLLSSCDFVRNNFQYSNTTKQFMNHLMHKEYDKCVGLMELSKDASRKTYVDTIKTGLDNFRTELVKKYGENIDYSYMRAKKSSSFTLQEIPNRTTIQLQISNDKELGVVEAMFDDKTGKLMTINPLGLHESIPIPDMSSFWFFGLIAICIPIFNIYMLRRVYHSDMVNKWQKYLAILFINIPAIGYAPVQGIFFRLFANQFFLGFYFVKMGYPGSTWVFGIPLGALYILWKLKKGNYTKDPAKAKKKVQGKR